MVIWIVLALLVTAFVVLALAVAPVVSRLGPLQRAVRRVLVQQQSRVETLQAGALTLQQQVLTLQERAEVAQRRLTVIKARRGD